MNRFRSLIVTFLIFSSFFFLLTSPSFASDIRTGEKIHLTTKEQFENLYSFGQEVKIDSRVTGDIVTGGSDVKIDGTPTGSILGAGGNIVISGNVGNSIRIAGGNVTVSGQVKHDVVVVGGTLTIEKTASIGGDILFAGGNLRILGPVRGKVLMSAGSVSISSVVGESVQGNAGTLFLQEGSEIKGDLNYTSSQRAIISDGAIVRGQDIYHATERKNGQEVAIQGLLYKLVADILFTFLLIALFPKILSRLLSEVRNSPLQKAFLAFGFVILMPAIALFSLLVLWLGVVFFLVYFLYLILALFLAKIIVGYYALSWWNKRSNTPYKLDWRTAVIGPLIVTLLSLVPIIGWGLVATVYLISLGTVLISTKKELLGK